jgi:hypothetical protein
VSPRDDLDAVAKKYFRLLLLEPTGVFLAVLSQAEELVISGSHGSEYEYGCLLGHIAV